MISYSWYQNLNKPFLSPPAWVFAPVWTLLYIMMFASLLLYATKQTSRDKSWGIVLFFSQFILNLCWSPAFFMLQNIGLALIIVIILDILVLWNIVEFSKVSKPAGILLIPYFIWIVFATYLNSGFFILN